MKDFKDITPTPHNSPVSPKRLIHYPIIQNNNWVGQNPPRRKGVRFADAVLVHAIKEENTKKCVIL